MHEHMFGLSDLQRREPDGLRSGHMQPVPDLWRRDAGLHAHRGQLPDLQRDDCDILHEHVQCRGPELSDVRSFVPTVSDVFGQPVLHLHERMRGPSADVVAHMRPYGRDLPVGPDLPADEGIVADVLRQPHALREHMHGGGLPSAHVRHAPAALGRHAGSTRAAPRRRDLPEA